MAHSLLSIPLELLTRIALYLDLEGFIRLWSTCVQLRQKLNPGSTIVKVGRLLLPLSKKLTFDRD